MGPRGVQTSLYPTQKITFYIMTINGALGDEDEGLEKVPTFMEHVSGRSRPVCSQRRGFLDRVFNPVDIGKAHE